MDLAMLDLFGRIPERTVASRLAVAKSRLRVMLQHSNEELAEGRTRGLTVAAD